MTNTGIYISSHAAGGLFNQIHQSGTLHFLGMTYTRKGEVSLRIPMETQEEYDSIHKTIERCVDHEVAENPTEFTVYSGNIHPVYYQLATDWKNVGPHNRHLKQTFLVEDCEGELRKEPKEDGDTIIGPPQWIEVRELLRRMRYEYTPPYHIDGVKAGLVYCCRKYPNIACQYHDLFSMYHKFGMNPEDLELVLAYNSRH